jgi:hypothetical protein
MKWHGDRLQVASRCSLAVGKDDSPPPIRALCLSADGESLVVGTQTCEVLELKLAAGGKFTSVGESWI